MLSQKRLIISALCLIVLSSGWSAVFAQGDGATRPRRVTKPETESTESKTAGPIQKTVPRFDDLPLTKNDESKLPFVGAYSSFNRSLMLSIESLLGTPYRYGANGDGYGIDCSGFVWRVYHLAGMDFQRTSAADMFFRFVEATDEEKSKFGTLVFFNNLGHVGIVKDKDHFYHASSSMGVTLSSFKGYWEDRVVGYRVVPLAD